MMVWRGAHGLACLALEAAAGLADRARWLVLLAAGPFLCCCGGGVRYVFEMLSCADDLGRRVGGIHRMLG